MNREEYLSLAALEMSPLFGTFGANWEKIRITCGFPHKNGVARRQKRIGECWPQEASNDLANEIMVSPIIDNAIEAMAVLAHELVHAAVGNEHGHKGPFRRLATAIGLEGKMTATSASEGLKSYLECVADKLGPYPHAALNPTIGAKKQTTRMIKLECSDCGYIVRTSRKNIDELGLPVCSCGNEFSE